MSSNKNILTIITAVRNLIESGREAQFEQCVESVAKQVCYGKIEHLIVDGGSTDRTMDLLQKTAAKYPIKVISKRDRSVYDGMNNGIKVASGDYILFLNSDDYLKDSISLSEVLQKLEISDVDVCYGDVEMILNGNSHRRILKGDISRLPFADHFCHQSMITKASVIREFDGFNIDYKICADNELTMRLYKAGKSFSKTNHIFVCYRDGGLSATCGRVARDEHAKAFYTTFGADMGMSLKDCEGLWYYSMLNTGSIEDCFDILAKLSESSWRKVWIDKIRDSFNISRKEASSPLSRIKKRYEEQGLKGLLGSIKRRMRRVK